jgi:hypothetical protein
MRVGWTTLCLCLAACGSSHSGGGPDATVSRDGPGGTDGSGSGSGVIGNTLIYAHTQSTLYSVDPTTLAVTKINDFAFDTGFDAMTDLAIDRNGNMIGVSFFSVYRVDPTTAAATRLAMGLTNTYNGLSFVPAAQVGMTGDDVLIGTRTTDGKVFQINPATGASTQVGDMGGSYSSSGDLVAVDGFGTVQTVKGSTHDVLARLAPGTFAATPIGTNTGFDKIWGVGFWGGTVYGFTNTGQFISIDPTTGAGQLVAANGPTWWGAAVTTIAPIIQ